MTDKQKLIALLTEFGVEFKVDLWDHHNIVTEKGDDKVTGYSCFYTTFEFDSEGNFIQMGAWE